MSVLKAKKDSKIKSNVFDDKPTTGLNLIINSELHSKFKIKTLQNKTSMTKAIVDFIRAYIKN